MTYTLSLKRNNTATLPRRDLIREEIYSILLYPLRGTTLQPYLRDLVVESKQTEEEKLKRSEFYCFFIVGVLQSKKKFLSVLG